MLKRPVTALLLGTALAACSEPMERPATPEEAAAAEESKTAEIPKPEIRDAKGISPQKTDEDTDAAPLFDPREVEAATAKFAAGNATRPEAIEDARVLGRASGSFTAPGANETAWLVEPQETGEDTTVPRLVLVSIGGITQEVALDSDAAGAQIVAAPDTNQDGLTELLLYTTTEDDTGLTGRATHLSLRSGELEILASWDLLTDPCDGTDTPPEAERTGSVLMLDADSGAISEDAFTAPC